MSRVFVKSRQFQMTSSVAQRFIWVGETLEKHTSTYAESIVSTDDFSRYSDNQIRVMYIFGTGAWRVTVVYFVSCIVKAPPSYTSLPSNMISMRYS